MESNIKLGRVWGIPIGLHWSWFAIFGLATWTLARGYFPQTYPGMSSEFYWMLGIVTSVLFFASVLLHELGHAWTSLRHGTPVKGISLFIFGGVAQIEREPKTAIEEFRVAIAGPIVSLLLALFFWGVLFLDRHIPFLAAPTDYLARINLILALFNLIPGFPLDGGRILRAIVWQRTGSLPKANNVAVASGQIFAFAFMIFGVFVIFSGALISGLWLIFIGWFLQNASAATFVGSSVQNVLQGVRVEQVMERDCPQVEMGTPLQRVIEDRVLATGDSTFAVTSGGRILGLITLRQIVAVPQEQRASTMVEKIMIPWDRLAHIHPNMDVQVAMKALQESEQTHAPILDGEQIVGLLSRDDVVNYIRVRAQLGT